MLEEINRDYDNKKHAILKTYLWNVIGTDGNPLLYTSFRKNSVTFPSLFKPMTIYYFVNTIHFYFYI